MAKPENAENICIVALIVWNYTSSKYRVCDTVTQGFTVDRFSRKLKGMFVVMPLPVVFGRK